ncbi:MAG: glycosyl hydrolase family 28-related protein [Gaiellales bacterium]
MKALVLGGGLAVTAMLSVPAVSAAQTVPPTPPSVRAQMTAADTVTVSWGRVTTAYSYRVYRDGREVGRTAALRFVDRGPIGAGAHRYAVRAYNRFLGLSRSSALASVLVPLAARGGGVVADTLPPTAPSNLTAPSPVTAAPVLSWSPSLDTGSGVARYKVFRNAVRVGVTTAPSFTDTQVAGVPSTYVYYVVAVDGAGNRSPASARVKVMVNGASASGDTTPPTAPGNLTAAPGSGSAALTWTASSDGTGVAGYDVFRNGTRVATVTGLAYTAAGLSCNTGYTFGVEAFDAANNHSPRTAVSITTAACPTPGGVFDVTRYGAGGADSAIDTAAFNAAVTAASTVGTPGNPGVVYVPQGTYYVANVMLKSNVTVQVEAGTVLRVASNASGNQPIFYLGSTANGRASFIDNVQIVGVNGRFTMDLSNTPTTRNHGISVLNVRHFTIANIDAIQNDSNPTGGAPSSYVAVIDFHSTPASVLGGTLYHPIDGTIENIHVTHAPYSYGATQVTAGEDLRFYDISSSGGIALRMETDGNSDVLMNVTADNISCDHGHAAVSFSPHDQNNYNIHVTNIHAVSCAEGVRLGGATGTGSGGTFVNSSVVGGTVVGGLGAQIPSPTADWMVGAAQFCVSDSSGSAYDVAISGLTCTGVR